MDWTLASGSAVRIYLAWDPSKPASPFTLNGTVLGFRATSYVEAAPAGGRWTLGVYSRGLYDNWVSAGTTTTVASDGKVMELKDQRARRDQPEPVH